MSALIQIREQLDRMAKGRQASRDVWAAGGGDFWTLVDAAADETYENRVKGATITALDEALADAALWSHSDLKQWFVLHNDYFSRDLAITTQPLLETYLETYGGWRVPFEAAESLVEALGSGSRLATERVFPVGTRPADAANPSTSGMHQFGRLTGTAGTPTYDSASYDGAISAYVKGAAVLAIAEEATPALSNVVLTCTFQSGSTVDVTAAAFSDATQYRQLIVGKEAFSNVAAAGQKVVPVAGHTTLAIGEWVLLYEGDILQEVAQIASWTGGITMVDNLKETYSASAFIYPLYTNVTLKAGQAGTIGNGKHVALYAYPDRIIAL